MGPVGCGIMFGPGRPFIIRCMPFATPPPRGPLGGSRPACPLMRPAPPAAPLTLRSGSSCERSSCRLSWPIMRLSLPLPLIAAAPLRIDLGALGLFGVSFSTSIYIAKGSAECPRALQRLSGFTYTASGAPASSICESCAVGIGWGAPFCASCVCASMGWSTACCPPPLICAFYMGTCWKSHRATSATAGSSSPTPKSSVPTSDTTCC
jgi:hypothetical protein